MRRVKDDLYSMELTTARDNPLLPAKRCDLPIGGGRNCKRFAVKGTTRCSLHGGHTPHARQRALETLAVAAVPAAQVLFEVIHDYRSGACEHCGRPTGDPGPVIRAAQIVLDRTGFHPSMTVNLKRQDPTPEWARYLTTDELTQMNTFIEEAKARMARGEETRDVAPIIDITPTAPDAAAEDDAHEL